ncbi:uncharacterized protein BDR25DRAFT_348947 [Lindgomyces ingoldianus]|uniref:Uncharacterized protein n=1 Tax=Lindgomyces ingoldianus TaxID=673940 RepID=A0ACB6RE81_9PLEO|nr:uncharacterized protein BDR25DRAFT_348947 [Lindgomyces ingoldianus]KAF2477053.1 hypothetical protein BDR25DRAFT_348947 [Lindgomyces ingoldianus]
MYTDTIPTSCYWLTAYVKTVISVELIFSNNCWAPGTIKRNGGTLNTEIEVSPHQRNVFRTKSRLKAEAQLLRFGSKPGIAQRTLPVVIHSIAMLMTEFIYRTLGLASVPTSHLFHLRLWSFTYKSASPRPKHYHSLQLQIFVANCISAIATSLQTGMMAGVVDSRIISQITAAAMLAMKSHCKSLTTSQWESELAAVTQASLDSGSPPICEGSSTASGIRQRGCISNMQKGGARLRGRSNMLASRSSVKPCMIGLKEKKKVTGNKQVKGGRTATTLSRLGKSRSWYTPTIADTQYFRTARGT